MSLKTVTVTFFCALFAVASCSHCPEGWDQFEEKCFKYHQINASFSEAKSVCSHDKATLVTIHSPEEEHFLMSKARPMLKGEQQWIWLGATRNESTNTFSWLNGEPITHSNWLNNGDNGNIAVECPDPAPNRGCAMMAIFKERYSFFWCNFDCDQNKDNVICEKPATPGPEPSHTDIAAMPSKEEAERCQPGWSIHGDKCYKLFPEPITGELAGFTCHFHYSAEMASIHSSEDQRFLTSFAFVEHKAQQPLLIGGKKMGTTPKDFTWTDGSPFTYTNWAPGEPNMGTNAGLCVAIVGNKGSTGRWKVQPCHHLLTLVCSKNARPAKVVSTTGAPKTTARPVPVRGPADAAAIEMKRGAETAVSPVTTPQPEVTTERITTKVPEIDANTTKAPEQKSIEKSEPLSNDIHEDHDLHVGTDYPPPQVAPSDDRAFDPDGDVSAASAKYTSLMICMFLVALIVISLVLFFAFRLRKKAQMVALENSTYDSSVYFDKRMEPMGVETNDLILFEKPKA